MNKRMLLLSLLLGLVLIGLIAGVFTNSIRRALTLQTPQTLQNPQTQPKVVSVPQTTPKTNPAPPQVGATPMLPVQMPQTLLAHDDFQRTDQPLWGTSPDGFQWTGDASTQTNIFSIAANHGQIMNGQGSFNALLGPSSNNMEALLVGSLSHFNGTVNLGAVLRYTDANNWYKALIDGTHLTLLRRSNNKTTQLANVAFVAQDNQPYSLRFRVVGAMLFARAWPAGSPEPTAWLVTAADNTFQSGKAGVRVVLQPGLTIAITNFAVSTASSTV